MSSLSSLRDGIINLFKEENENTQWNGVRERQSQASTNLLKKKKSWKWRFQYLHDKTDSQIQCDLKFLNYFIQFWEKYKLKENPHRKNQEGGGAKMAED